jgi:hypothetical protein
LYDNDAPDMAATGGGRSCAGFVSAFGRGIMAAEKTTIDFRTEKIT